MQKKTHYLPLAALCVAIFFSSCKNEGKVAETNAVQTDTNAVQAPMTNSAQATADSIAMADAAALAAAKEDSIAKATAAAEMAAKNKGAKTTAKPATKPVEKPASKTSTTAALPKKPTTPPVATPVKKDGNVKKRTGKDDVFVISETKPAYPGGDNAMMKYLKSTIKYPVRAKEEGIKGTVYMRFVVEKDGSVTDVEVAKGVNPLLDAEAKRVVSSMQKWAPGKQNGTNVAVQYTLPVKFDLIE